MATQEFTTGAPPELLLDLVDALTDRIGKAKAITTMMGREPRETENHVEAEVASMAVADLLEDAVRIGTRLFELARTAKGEVAA